MNMLPFERIADWGAWLSLVPTVAAVLIAGCYLAWGQWD